MSERKQIIPQYGPFAGMRVIDSGSLIAMPYAATLLADFGAEVIHIERPGVGDTLRVLAPFAKEDGKTVSTSWAQDGRNKLSLSLELNLKHPEVKELFFGLIKEADVFMENMVWLEKLGIRDEELLEVNPKLIIAHISGYGNPRFGGLPEYCDRASYDMIGQAFSGWMGLNGEKGGDPVVGKPWLNDFTSAYATVFAVLAAYINVLKGRATARSLTSRSSRFRRATAATCTPPTPWPAARTPALATSPQPSSPTACSSPRTATMSRSARSAPASTREPFRQ